MGRKAVDVVLLPSEAMMDKAIEVNRQLVERFDGKITLNKEDCLPHISLAMGCVDEKEIPAIEKVLQAIAKECPLGNLRTVGIRAGTNAQGEKVSVLEVEKTEQLQLLHEKVMEEIGPYFSGDVTGDTVAGAEAAESTLQWIRDYREKSSFAKFFPHITVGYGEIANRPVSVEFKASKLALCHLGNHCTCREILVSIELKRV